MNLDEQKNWILQRLNLQQEYARLGLQFVGDEPNDEGWLTYRAMGREDANPSAGVNLCTGYYKDFGGEAESLNLFDFAARYGGHADWKAVLQHYGQQTGLPVSHDTSHNPTKSRDASRLRTDQLAYLKPVKLAEDLQRFLKRRPPLTLEALLACQVRQAVWPAGSPHPLEVLVFSGYRDLRDSTPPAALLMYRRDGLLFPPVPNTPLKERKTHLIRGSKDSWVMPGGKQRVQDAEVLWKVEGIPDALSLYPHLPAEHAVVTNTHGAGPQKNTLGLFKHKQVIVLGDADVAGQQGASRFARRLLEEYPYQRIKLVQLPYEIQASHGRDLRDYFNGGGDFPSLWKLVEATEPLASAPPDGRPSRPDGTGSSGPEPPAGQAPDPEPDRRITVEVVPDVHLMTEQVCAVIGRHELIFQRGGNLVRVLREGRIPDGISREPGAPRIEEIPVETLRDCISSLCRFEKIIETQEDMRIIREPPPLGCVKAVAAERRWPGVRHLGGVVDYPVLRRDGSILSAPGYDAATGLIYEPSQIPPPIPEQPTPAEIQAALQLLRDLVGDFPFQTPEHEAAWVAYLLTPLARFTFSGPSPLFLVDANVRGSGKSLLCDLVSMVVSGRRASRMSNPRDDEECRKQITALVLKGDSFVLLDNIVGALGCAALDAALTGTSWKDRKLGKSEIVDMPLYIVWGASGNNVMLAADTSRRVCHIRLESDLERPEERVGFKYPNLIQHAREHRGELLAAALTLLRGYFAAGAPDLGLSPWGSFEGWSAVVRSVVVWAGLPDPAATKQELMEQSDREANALAGILYGLYELDPEGDGLTSTEILDALKRHADKYQTLREGILELCYVTSADQLPSSRQLGGKLTHLKRRVLNGLRLDTRVVRKTNKWVVAEVSLLPNQTKEAGLAQDASAGGDGGDVSITAPQTGAAEQVTRHMASAGDVTDHVSEPDLEADWDTNDLELV